MKTNTYMVQIWSEWDGSYFGRWSIAFFWHAVPLYFFRCSSSPCNPVYVRRVDFSVLVFSLSSHLHSYIGFVFSSRFLDSWESRSTSTPQFGCQKDPHLVVDQLVDLFHRTHTVKTQHVTKTRGLLLLVRLGGYIVNLWDFYSYSLIGKLTVFLYLQEYPC